MTEEHIRISWDVENSRDIIHLPEVVYSYFDDQAGAVDIGLDREWMKTLHRMLGEWITVTSYVDRPLVAEVIESSCVHEETWFDRTVCPEPCGLMHTYCCTCAKSMDGCLTEDLTISLQELRDGKSVPAKTWDEEFLYDGQGRNEMCHCGHAAMVHTSGSGNCLALGETAQEDSHCLEFLGQTDDVSDDCCSDTCTCEDVPMVPVTVCTACLHADPHDAGGIGVCRADGCGCDGPLDPCECGCDDPLEPCGDCGHATVHGEGTPGKSPQYCEVDGCNCTGREDLCHECPHSFWQHQQGDDGCPQCDCRVGERVKPPVLHLCDRCHGEVHTFPEEIIALAQRMEEPNDRWASFFYKDRDGDELLISDAFFPSGGKETLGVNLTTPADGVFLPLGVLEAVISAIRESGHRAIISEGE